MSMSYLIISLSRESWNGLTGASGSRSITVVQSRCLLCLWSQLKVQLGENPLLSSLTWQLAGIRSMLLHVTIDWLMVLAEYWPNIIVLLHLSFFIGLLTTLQHVSSETEESRRKSKIKATGLF